MDVLNCLQLSSADVAVSLAGVARDSESSLGTPARWLLHRERDDIGKICVPAQTSQHLSVTATRPEE